MWCTLPGDLRRALVYAHSQTEAFTSNQAGGRRRRRRRSRRRIKRTWWHDRWMLGHPRPVIPTRQMHGPPAPVAHGRALLLHADSVERTEAELILWQTSVRPVPP
ncbi:unnamed protein product [Pleuronectes platessa]|uniref:Uncharacterized protein n=1 Tax=Pleuronectes platessa TaxID=8262 RepID=A0A9N7UIG2_PLEPL|nr:unnamed protein product [Pleuronectes platessa]